LKNLNRPQPPHCLSLYKNGTHKWDDVTPEHKQLIWDSLYGMQGEFCAYCECKLIDRKKHIEHFVQKGKDSSKTFTWDNLFGSCKYIDRCGVYKDTQKYNAVDLIKADIDKPESFFCFLTDGSIKPRRDLSPLEERRAEVTIKVFRLDQQLKQIRFSFIQPHVDNAEYLYSLIEDLSKDEWLELVNEELDSLEGLPFYSAIKSVFMSPQQYDTTI
jgi:uncharacterized protein (TIGR02646 family)